MTNNSDWNRRDAGDGGAQNDPNGSPAEQGEQRPESAPPPWDRSGDAGSQPDSTQTHNQTPWDRPGQAPGQSEPQPSYTQTPWDRQGQAPGEWGSESSYSQTPWDRPASGAGASGSDQAYGQTPWSRPASGDAPAPGPYSPDNTAGYTTPIPPQASGYGQAAPPNQGNAAPTYGAGPGPYANAQYGSAPYGSPQNGNAPYGGTQSPNAPYTTNSYGTPQYGTAPAPGHGNQPYPSSPYGFQGYGFGGGQAPMRPRMGFMQAMTAWVQNYARFNGRAGLSEYWWTVLGNAVVVLVLELALVTAGRSADGGTNALGNMIAILLSLWGLATFLPNLAVAVRRLHDTNRSGWTYLLSFIPLVGSIIVLVFTLGGSNPAGARFDGADQPRTGE